MANNPLDELVQTSPNPVAEQPAQGVNAAPNTPGLSSLPPIPEPAVGSSSQPASPVNSPHNPLDELISDAVQTSTPAGSPRSSLPHSSSASPFAPSNAVANTPQSTPAPMPMPDPAEAQPSAGTTHNPLDSLITSQPEPATHKLTPVGTTAPLGLGAVSAATNPLAQKPVINPLDALTQTKPNVGLAMPKVTENHIPVDAPQSKPPSLTEHDIMPASKVMETPKPAFTPMPSPNSGIPLESNPPVASTLKPREATALSQQELEEKAKKLLKDSPAKTKSSKKPWIVGLLTLLVVIGAAGGGLLSYKLYKGDSTDNRSKAGFVGQNACVSPKGIAVPPGQSSANQSGLFNYRPASATVSDATKYYDVSKNEGVSFSVQVTNTTSTPLNDQYHFFAQKVTESPRGTAVNAQSPLDEATLEVNHRNNGDVQETVFNSGNMNFSLGANETKTLTGLWTPNNNECGLYQIDMGVVDFDNAACATDLVVGAGFVRVMGCQNACNTTCSSNDRCTSMNSTYACVRNQVTADWSETTTSYSAVGAGTIACFNSSNNPTKDQHLVRGGKIWSRSFTNNTWTNWSDVTANVSSAGTGVVTSFSSFIGQDGHTQQHIVREGKIWYRKVEGNAWQTAWEEVTSNVDEVGSGQINGFNVYLKDGLYEAQFLVKGGKVYRRDSRDGWSAWEEVTTQFDGVGQGDITCASGISEQTSEVQSFVRGGKVYTHDGDWFEGQCRLASNPSSQTCAPAPTPETLACTSLTKTPAAPKLGDVVTFTCAAAPAPVAKYEFRYAIASGTYVSLTPEAANPNTAKLTLTSSGAYKVECRACEDAAATTCTTWGIAR